ncbi:MAG: hypothetical protein JXA21_12305 [Anaerolineae bacterium]|nr:hypothetical protein [Anaerolineae bacterium]
MEARKNLLIVLGEWLEARRTNPPAMHARSERLVRTLRWFLPNGGTLLIVVILLMTQSLWARPFAAPNAPGPSATTVNYQGRLADNAGVPLDGSYAMRFALYDAATDGILIWGPEIHDAVPVSDGLFSVGLGSQTSGGIPTSAWNGDRYLEITVGGETLSPRELIRSVPIAGMALTVPDGAIGTSQIADGAITSDKLAFTDGYLDMQRKYIDNIGIGNAALEIGQSTSSGYMYFDLEEGRAVAYRNNTVSGSAPFMFIINAGGSLEAFGALDMNGNAIINQGAMVEANLQTPAELAAERIDRFSEGDVLCWGDERLELCAQSGDPLVQAVADENGKPIVIGAEVIKVLGPVQRGDLLVASNVPGYAMTADNPAPGAVIAQALADFAGERGVVKAMVRKF